MKVLSNILLVILTFFSLSIFSQEEKLELKLDRGEILLGDQIKAQLILTQSVTSDIPFPILTDTLSAKIEIVERGKIDTTFEGSNLETKIYSQELILTSFDSGYHAIPPILAQAGEKMLQSDPMLITVNDVEVEMPEPAAQGQQPPEVAIKDIKDIQEASFSLWEWIKLYKYWILLVILVIAGVWVYFKYIQPKLLDKELINVIPSFEIPPDEIAKRKLKELEERKLWQQGKFKDYHIELSEIVREYIENRYVIPALESTTPEILEDLGGQGIQEVLLGDLRTSLELSDLVKFAKYIPQEVENEQCMKFSLRFIEMSKKEKEASEINVNSEHV